MTSFQQLHQPTNRTLDIDQKEYLFFGGTSYLGLLVNEGYQLLVKEGIDRYGLNNGTSRSNNVQLGIYDEAESVLASRFGFADAALFSSGYLAAQATIHTFAHDGEVYYAPGAHPALWISGNPVVLADDFQDWLHKVVLAINSSTKSNFVLIANAIDNLKPELYDFSYLSNIDSSKKVLLLIDDSHGLGIAKKNAPSSELGGIINMDNIEIVVIASLAKGLGTDAGVVLGTNSLVTRVRQSAIFRGASPSSPAFIYALIKSEAIYQQAFTKLHDNINFFTQNLPPQSGLVFAPLFPVFTSNDTQLYAYLCKNNLLISSFPYPLPTSRLLNRVVISALHTQQDILKLTNLLQSKA